MAENETKQDEQPTENADNTSVAKSKQRIWPAILLIVCVILGTASAAVVAASVIIRPAPEKTPETVAAKEQAGESKDSELCEFTLEEPLIVNVYQTQQRRYLSVKPVLVLRGKAALDQIKSKQVELQHLLIGILKHKTLEQLDDPDAPNSIGREVQEMANLKLDVNASVESVYFTQFVVQ
jgi:flagellar FliL protein